MYKKSTLNESSDDYCRIVKKEKNPGMMPGKETLSFLMQFARVYHVEKEIPAALSGMVLN